jgi:hypothetical protein
MELGNAGLKRRFNYHAPKDQETAERHDSVRAICLEAAEVILEETGPSSREQSLAITHLETAMFWANAAIARGPDPLA